MRAGLQAEEGCGSIDRIGSLRKGTLFLCDESQLGHSMAVRLRKTGMAGDSNVRVAYVCVLLRFGE